MKKDLIWGLNRMFLKIKKGLGENAFMHKKCYNWVLVLIVITVLGMKYPVIGYAYQPEDHVVMVTAEVQESPAKIILKWPAPPIAVTSYEIYRKGKTDSSWGDMYATLPGTATSYEDNAVNVGAAYEYKIAGIREGAALKYTSTGYIYAGIQFPAVESRGKVILIVDDMHAEELSYELERLKQDLNGDGWIVLRHDVDRADTPQYVKGLIQADYNADPENVKAVFLFGHIPVCWSGNIMPDGHVEHNGPWPADAFYGDMDGIWTDNINFGTKNSPGDGKMDQYFVPSDLELQVGRVDFYDMPEFSESETELLRRYLDKSHKYRWGEMEVDMKGFIHDDCGEFQGEAFSQNGYRAFPPLLGENAAIETGVWKEKMLNNSYIWSHMNGPGGPGSISSDKLRTADLADNIYKTIFGQMFGSWFGDWALQNNIMRAFLGMKDYGLTCVWAGRPNWFFHHMGLGETIGYSTRLTQNNGSTSYPSDALYLPEGSSAGYVHIALMGYPTLRMYPVMPPTNVYALINQQGAAEIKWAPSLDNVLGYHVYKAENPDGPYHRVTPDMVNGFEYIDYGEAIDGNYYMVRAVKLESTGSGSFYNLSQGVIVQLKSPEVVTPLPVITPSQEKLKATVFSLENKVNISGRLKGDEGKPVSVKIINPAGDIEYLYQDSIDGNGNYLFEYFTNMDEIGIYDVFIRIKDAENIMKTYFEIVSDRDLFEVGDITLTPETVLEQGSYAAAKTLIKNNSGMTSDVMLAFALYDADNTLLKISMDPQNIADGDTKSLETGFLLSSPLDGCYLKAFVWQGVASLKSLCNSKRFEISDQDMQETEGFESPEFMEDGEGYISVPEPLAPEKWGTYRGENISVDYENGFDGNKVVKFNSSSEHSAMYYRHVDDALGTNIRQIYECRVKFPTKPSVESDFTISYGSDLDGEADGSIITTDKNYYLFSFDKDGVRKRLKKPNNTYFRFEANKWYTIQLELDFSIEGSNMRTLYVYDDTNTLLATDITPNAGICTVNNNQDPNYIVKTVQFKVNGFPGKTVMVDDIKIYSPSFAGPVSFYSDGSSLTNCPAQGSVLLGNAKLSNISISTSKSARLIMGLYKDNRFMGLSTSPQTNIPAATLDQDVWTDAVTVTENGCTANIMIWDSLENMNPLADITTLTSTSD